MKRKIDSHGGADMIKLVLSDLPGGADAFTLVAKFCYGIKFEIDVTNVAMLRCAAEYLEMTEEYGKDVALVSNTENVLTDVVFTDLKSTIQVLCSCQTLLPVAEDLRIVSRCINAIACILCRSSSKDSLGKHGFSKLGDSMNQTLLLSGGQMSCCVYLFIPFNRYYRLSDLKVCRQAPLLVQ